jgi:hypothetical protein
MNVESAEEHSSVVLSKNRFGAFQPSNYNHVHSTSSQEVHTTQQPTPSRNLRTKNYAFFFSCLREVFVCNIAELYMLVSFFFFFLFF